MKKTIIFLFALVSCTAFGQRTTQSIANGNWNNASTWSNGVPGSRDTAIVNNNVSITSSSTVAKIVINSMGKLTNQSTLSISHALTNNGTFTDVSGTVDFTNGTWAISVGGSKSTSFYNLTIDNNGGVNVTDTIIVKNGLSLSRGTLNVSSGYLILQNDATYNGRVISVGYSSDISGTFRAEIWDNRCSTSSIASDYSTYCPPMATNLSSMGLLLYNNAYTYDETQPGNKSVGYVAVPTNTTTIKRGQGFFYDYSNFNGGPNFARKIPIIGTLSFSGSFTFPITFTTTVGGGTNNDGWNLVGNPYPGTIDWESYGWNMSRVDNAVYTWNTCSNLYAIYASGVAINGGSRYINEFQGFWVHANRSFPQLTASASVITNNNSSLLRTFSFADSVPMAVHVMLGSDEMAVRLDNNATDTFDILYDAREFFTDSSRIYSFVNGDTADPYAINAVKDSVYKVVPFAVHGSGTLTFTGIASMNNHTVYLKDLYTLASYHLSDGFQYSYRQSPLKDTIFDSRRFRLIFRDSTFAISGVNPDSIRQITSFYPNPSSGVVVLNCYEPGSILTIYDLLGQEVISQKLENNKTLLHLNFPNGTYIIKVQSANKVLLQDKLEIVKS